MTAATPLVTFEMPGGRLSFAEGQLDEWAEHLVWCYRLLGVDDGATLAVQDFGTSPLSFLGSRLLIPTLVEGVAERMGGRVLCLDASEERVLLTPGLLRLLTPDRLVVRGEVLGLLLEIAKQAGVDLSAAAGILAVPGERLVPRPGVSWRYLLLSESAMLLAPECTACDAFHLRAGYYELDGETVRNLRLPDAGAHWLPGATLANGGCALGPDDRRVLLPLGRET